MTGSDDTKKPDGATAFPRSMHRIELVKEYERVDRRLMDACGAKLDLVALSAAWMHFGMVRVQGISLWSQHLDLVRAMAREYFEQVPLPARRIVPSVPPEARRRRFQSFLAEHQRLDRSQAIGTKLAQELGTSEGVVFGTESSHATAVVKSYVAGVASIFWTFEEYLDTHFDFIADLPHRVWFRWCRACRESTPQLAPTLAQSSVSSRYVAIRTDSCFDPQSSRRIR